MAIIMQFHCFCIFLLHVTAVPRSPGQLNHHVTAAVPTGSAEVDTTTVAAQGGEAVASQSADKGKHSQVTAAVGNSTVTIIKKDDKSFDEAPACAGNATDDATTDALGHKVCFAAVPLGRPCILYCCCSCIEISALCAVLGLCSNAAVMA